MIKMMEVKNLFEEELLLKNLNRLGEDTSKISYTKKSLILILVERLLIKYQT